MAFWLIYVIVMISYPNLCTLFVRFYMAADFSHSRSCFLIYKLQLRSSLLLLKYRMLNHKSIKIKSFNFVVGYGFFDYLCKKYKKRPFLAYAVR